MAMIEEQEPHRNPWSVDACPADSAVVPETVDLVKENELGAAALQSSVRGNFFQEESTEDLALDPLIERFKRIQQRREAASRPVPETTTEAPNDSIRRSLISRQRKKLGR